jgi:hypothetical protein
LANSFGVRCRSGIRATLPHACLFQTPTNILRRASVPDFLEFDRFLQNAWFVGEFLIDLVLLSGEQFIVVVLEFLDMGAVKCLLPGGFFGFQC